jgi:hypothetical protein
MQRKLQGSKVPFECPIVHSINATPELRHQNNVLLEYLAETAIKCEKLELKYNKLVDAIGITIMSDAEIVRALRNSENEIIKNVKAKFENMERKKTKQ